MGHRISAVEEESIANELGIIPGDILLTVEGEKIIDVLDYRFRLQTENLIVEIEKPDGEVWEIDIEKDFDEDLGLEFEMPLMSELKPCKNNCLFCFIDQEPKGLRETLYIKDDDWRLSFLHGNYVTLTNLSESEASRIASLHLSPLYISVHAADEAVRKRMMNFTGADNLFRYLHLFGEAGIEMHFQIVLCKGINDGAVLADTLKKLQSIKGAKSIALVPAGLTRHRQNLYPIELYSSHDAQKLVRFGVDSGMVYFSDEWYLLGNVSLPSYETYKDFPQLANGVGLIRLFERDFIAAISEPFIGQTMHQDCHKSILIITGILAEPFMKQMAVLFGEKCKNLRLSVFAITNRFYGESITVSGLLTGGDIINQLYSKIACDVVFLPENAFKSGTEEMIDGLTREQIENSLNVRVRLGSQNGGIFAKQLCEELR